MKDGNSKVALVDIVQKSICVAYEPIAITTIRYNYCIVFS